MVENASAQCTLSSRDLLALDDLVYFINSSSSVPEIQEQVLLRLRDLVSYDSATFFLPERSGGLKLLGSPVAVDYDNRLLTEYEEHYQQIDYLLWIFRLSEPVTYRETDLIGDPLRSKSPFFNEYIRRSGTYYVAGLSVVHRGTLCGAVTLYRTKQHGDFDGRALSVLSFLQRHLANRLYQLLYPGSADIPDLQASSTRLLDNLFTPREREVARLVITGLDTEKIARMMNISSTTVKKHLDNMFKKLGVHSRLELMRVITAPPC